MLSSKKQYITVWIFPRCSLVFCQIKGSQRKGQTQMNSAFLLSHLLMHYLFKSKGKNITYIEDILFNHKNYNFLDCDWFKRLLFSTNSLVKLLSDMVIWLYQLKLTTVMSIKLTFRALALRHYRTVCYRTTCYRTVCYRTVQ